MTRDQVEVECRRHGWTLDSDWSRAGGVESIVVKPATAPHERVEIGRGDTAKDAFLAACHNEGKSPF